MSSLPFPAPAPPPEGGKGVKQQKACSNTSSAHAKFSLGRLCSFKNHQFEILSNMYWHAAAESPNWKSHLTSHATDVVDQGDKRTSFLAESNTDLVDYAREENAEWKSTILMHFF